MTAVFMSNDCVDIYNPKTIRSTMGSIYRVPFVYVDDLLALLDKFQKEKRSQLMRRILREKILMTRRIISQGQQFSLEMREMD